MTIREQTNAALAQAVSQGIITGEDYSFILALQKEIDYYNFNPTAKAKEGYELRTERAAQIFTKVFG